MAAKTEPDATTNGFADVTPTASATATAFSLVDYLSRPIHSIFTMAPRPSITGFDPKKFAAASANGTKGDPWARYEQWRYTGPFTRFNRFKGSFPGLGIATVAFAGYVVAEQLFFQDKGHHDDHA
ncbi:hypothetical protein GGP41_007364 [Bipolaris sorokiniana]|uniref:NADH-ubiquinone oxidoreductase B12 subunit n=5 Tax=Bipolaris TaxID=33194 RepID=A0A8H6E0P8_COCSA|nr:hypothetical protein GGP41_007364 [Bipolaris sorokiniana]